LFFFWSCSLAFVPTFLKKSVTPIYHLLKKIYIKQSSSKAMKSSSLIIGKSVRTMGSSVTVELLPAVCDAQSTPGNVILLTISSPSSMQRGHPLYPSMSFRTLYECSCRRVTYEHSSTEKYQTKYFFIVKEQFNSLNVYYFNLLFFNNVSRTFLRHWKFTHTILGQYSDLQQTH
jgi:hypothetical protein